MVLGTAPLFALALIFAAMNLGAEVVTLTTVDAAGQTLDTPLWVLDDGDALWIRAERPTSDWLRRLRERPRIELERDGKRRSYRALPMPEEREHVNRLMADRYGWVEVMMARFQNRSAATPIRLIELVDPKS